MPTRASDDMQDTALVMRHTFTPDDRARASKIMNVTAEHSINAVFHQHILQLIPEVLGHPSVCMMRLDNIERPVDGQEEPRRFATVDRG
jgi:hypothetical protein